MFIERSKMCRLVFEMPVLIANCTKFCSSVLFVKFTMVFHSKTSIKKHISTLHSNGYHDNKVSMVSTHGAKPTFVTNTLANFGDISVIFLKDIQHLTITSS